MNLITVLGNKEQMGLSNELCEKLISMATGEKHKGEVYSQNQQIKTDTKTRTVDVWAIPRYEQSNDIYGHILQRMIEACKGAGWEFEINHMETLQLLKYSKDAFYDWHMDIEPEADQKSQRKLSVTILLNNPNEFKGGELELKLGDENLKAELAKGSMAFFPSFSLHRITKVTEGTRWAAVAWFRGPRFR
tara:strand:- start:1030 stop:1599 length:570 start_codon:yes stop_codon:yes gene_type:complete